MQEERVMLQVDKISPSCIRFFVMNSLDKILIDPKMSRSEIIERIVYIRDEVDRYC